MLLCIDIGNTNIMLGLFEYNSNLAGSQSAAVSDVLGPHWRIATNHNRMADEYAITLLALLEHAEVAPQQIHGVCIASGVPVLTSRWSEVAQRYLGCEALVVHSGMKTGLTILYDNPAAVGADRVVDAAAAFNRYGGPLCIVDCGTATTFEIVTEAGEYLGGAISPGIGVAADALYRRAARLPQVDLLRPPSPIGRNTVHSIQSGLLFGYVGLVEGMVARFRREMEIELGAKGDAMQVIGTGGLVPIIASETNVFDLVEPWLTLDGLRLLYTMNQ